VESSKALIEPHLSFGRFGRDLDTTLAEPLNSLWPRELGEIDGRLGRRRSVLMSLREYPTRQKENKASGFHN
jgi:hypothetical protein